MTLHDEGNLPMSSTAVVTGAASGMGRACVDQVRGQADVVFAVDLRAPDIAGAIGLACDVSDPASVRALAERVAQVDSNAYYEPCVGACGDEAFFQGDGFMLMDDTGYGHLSGSVRYKVNVPAAGTYTIWYWVGTHAATPNATIRAQVGTATVNTNVAKSGGGWWYKQSAPISFLPAPTTSPSRFPPTKAAGTSA
jgi:NAD(P)-dependent dehydrogenase (short-subunit alcohol dehydrogenase family)